MSDLLRRDVVCLGPQVYLLVHVDAGNHEEDPRAPRLACQHPTQPEHHRTLVLLHHLDTRNPGHVTRDTWPHLDHPAEGEGEGDADEEEGDDGEDVCDEAGRLVTLCHSRDT